ncbi:16S rRNA (cytosine(967)-C(5))-methyltransferase RsmB [bacterium]|nr:16S rRNA (cytosine(967)-C(5))-methyltransferase RsmB [bacterium]
MTTNNPRQAACEILVRIEKDNAYADILIDRELSGRSLSGPDRALLTELVFGVLRRRGTLDYLIDLYSTRKSDKLERVVLVLLRLGLYQMFFLDRIPVSAAVNETVKLAKIFAPRAAGFINAVLRRFDRERDTVTWPDRKRDPAGFLCARHSHPRWLVEEWLRRLGAEEAESLAEAMAESAPLTIRVNTLKTSRDDLLERLAAEGTAAVPARYSPVGIQVLSAARPGSLAGFREGLCTVQDESSQLASLFLAPAPGEAVLDLCAAPGGKATHLAQIMENRGTLIACDRDRRKLVRIGETAARLGTGIVSTMTLDASLPLDALGTQRFHRILVDAPCTGLGVIRRNPEAKWRLLPSDPVRLSELQRTILRNAAERLAGGGVLLYSTCSTSLEENEAVIDDFVSERDDFVIEDLRVLFPEHAPLFTERGMFRSWPHRHGMDGFFAARLRKTSDE